MKFKFLPTNLAIAVAIALTARVSAHSNSLSITEKLHLTEELHETSGLVCHADQIFTINDSGNAPAVFSLNETGKIVDKIQLAVPNIDWEAIDADDAYLYIADTGNNHGNRQRVQVHKWNRQSGEVSSVSIAYKDNRFDRNIPYQHDYDVEAMVVHNGQLLLFTKSWRSGVANVYQVDVEEKQQVVTPIANIDGLPGVVTGAAWDSQRNVFLLVGYSGNALTGYTPYLAQISEQYKVQYTSALSGLSQVEAICIRADGEIWITQEGSRTQPSKLIKLSLPSL
ncbi:hypothetical protein [Alteromonas ponticola]|uniref:SMP-30/Gluconolactonase/LRE-like region domain-containing protein n=1 Tax=Alteromonas ponticola TaxID=2720613 RepID=A0ABX1R3C4_9ALTE|nr:hypothetical protein [Alteromonas ponticola]NMH59991.1 hypothetical protein [Alteromonas ponticola]